MSLNNLNLGFDKKNKGNKNTYFDPSRNNN